MILFFHFRGNRKRSSRSKVLSIWGDTADRINIIIFGIIGMLGVQYAYFMSIKLGNAATIVTIFWMHVSLGMFELLGGICIICTVLILTLA
jgi:hypothetical protein